jgi:anti-sigma factor ChrR (cupin superfamily)
MSHRSLECPAALAVLASVALIAPGFASQQAHAAEPAISHAVVSAELEWGSCPEFFPAGCQIAVLHGDPAKPNVDVFFRVPGNYDLPAHWHTSAERMVLLSGLLDITYDGQPTTSLLPGMYAYGPAGLPHSGRCKSDDACVLFIAFESPLDAAAVASEAK